jgi:hypothetical protein
MLTLITAASTLTAACTSSSDNGSGAAASDYCSLLASYVSKCNVTDACTVATSQACTQEVTAYSTGYLDAVTSCAANFDCTDGGSSTISTCINTKVEALTPTSTQQKLATDFCNQCASSLTETASACATSFFAANTSGTGTGAAGLGTEILEFNDTITSSIDSSCATATVDAGVLGCVTAFEICASAVLVKAVTEPAACQSSTNGSSAPLHFAR